MSYVKKCRRDCPMRTEDCHAGCRLYEEDCEDAKRRREYLQKVQRVYGSTIIQRKASVEKAIRKHGKPR